MHARVRFVEIDESLYFHQVVLNMNLQKSCSFGVVSWYRIHYIYIYILVVKLILHATDIWINLPPTVCIHLFQSILVIGHLLLNLQHEINYTYLPHIRYRNRRPPKRQDRTSTSCTGHLLNSTARCRSFCPSMRELLDLRSRSQRRSVKRGDHLTGQQVEALDGWQLVEGVAADMG